jgi:DNA-directed RNA polymerase subunit alpha
MRDDANIEKFGSADRPWSRYVPSEINEKYIEEIGTIPIDATFSPVTRVKYRL